MGLMKVTCIVDDAVDGHSHFWGEHGVCFLIETADGRLLFDTGQSGTVLLHNLREAGVDPAQVDALAVSHAHYDHTGGLAALLPKTGAIPLFAHPDVFRERFSRRTGQPRKIGPAMTRDELQAQVRLRLSEKPQEILPGVYTTGEITSRSELEGRSPRHLIKKGEDLIADPYHDDMSIVLRVRDGWVLVCGCCHAGLLNTLQQVRSDFGERIVAVLGGMHLNDMNDGQMQHIIAVLRGYGPPKLYPNHCTGLRAYMALAGAFESQVAPCPASTVVAFEDAA
jgi:7,8-dihydropterin-6-yl-methyl-4-(beta-D-ribofuranosyl)aminobenzene 5'-phosphate synthase